MRVVNINLNNFQKFNELIEMIDSLDEVKSDLLNFIGYSISNIWMQEYDNLNNKQKGWNEKAKQAIQFKTSGNNVEIYADSQMTDPRTGVKYILFVNILETGIRSWSIKEALLKSKRVKISKEGVKFIIVPFRWATPSRSKAKTNPIFAGTMTKEIYNIVKTGQRLGKEYGRLSGLKKYDRGYHTSYFTFRTVSEKSQGWIYPNIPGHRVYEKVLDKVENTINEIVETYVQALFEKIRSMRQ
jgi:hypothetical protein